MQTEQASRTEPEGFPRPPRALVAALSAGLPVAALIAVQAVAPAAERTPSGPARFDLAASWLAAEPGALAGAPWSQAPVALGRLQLGVLLHLARAIEGGTVLAAAQLVLLAVAALQAVLLWLLLRRLGCGSVAAGLATAVLGIAPAAVSAHTTVTTAGIATAWALAALLLVLRGGRPTGLLAGVAGALAVASSPLLALPLGVLAVVHRRRALVPVLVPVLGAAAAFAVAAAGAAVLAAAPRSTTGAQLAAVSAAQPGPVPGSAAPVAWATTDPLGLLVAGVAVVVLARRPGGRAVAIAAVLLLAASVWPSGADPAGPLVPLLALTAVATGVAAQRGVAALGDPVFRRSLVGSGWLTGVAALLLVGVVVCLTGLPRLIPRADRPVVAAGRWLRGVPSGELVLVGLGAWPDLDGTGRATVAWYAGRSGPVPSSAPWRDADWVLADSSLATAGGTAGAVLGDSVAVARLGTGADALSVRAVRGDASPAPSPSSTPSASPQPTPTAPTSAVERRAAAARVSSGGQLAANPRIHLDAPARALLVDGDVDARIAFVLAQFATEHEVTVASFTAEPGDASGIRTSVLISAVDGHRVPADVARTGELLRFLSALRGDFAARGIDATDAGVTASFTPDPTWTPS